MIRGRIGVTSIEVASIEDKIREAKLCTFGHLRRRPRDASMRRCGTVECLDYENSRCRVKKS